MSSVDPAVGPPPRHVFTVDVEEYFHVHAFRDLVHRDDWECFPSRVHVATERLLQLLEEVDTRATFFVLGWIAERYPDLVKRIDEAGHEVASHGYGHQQAGDLGREAFRRDARKSKRLLEEVTGRPVLGYRAPRFSLQADTRWMLEVLVEEGYRYDSSLVPARMIGGGGYPGADRRPQIVPTSAGGLLELPLATARWAGLTVPAAGGAYLRHLPYPLIRSGFRQAEEEGRPGVFYIHPWELDPDQPKIPAPASVRLRHYRNLHRTEERLRRVLEDFAFTSACERFGLDRGAPVGGTAEGSRGECGDGRRARRLGS